MYNRDFANKVAQDAMEIIETALGTDRRPGAVLRVWDAVADRTVRKAWEATDGEDADKRTVLNALLEALIERAAIT